MKLVNCKICEKEIKVESTSRGRKYCDDCNERRRLSSAKKSYRKNKKKRKEYYSKPEQKLKQKWKRLNKVFGLSEDDWKKMYSDQEGLCYLCLRTEQQLKRSRFKHKGFVVDHDHETNRIRGLLCNNCNLLLSGWVKDSPEMAIRIHEYLTRQTNYGFAPKAN